VKAINSSPVETEKMRRFLCCAPSSSLTDGGKSIRNRLLNDVMNARLICGVFVRTRTFPGGDVGSAGGEPELDAVWNAQFLQKLCALRLEDPNTRLREA
jgi:hypothetical protein